MLAKLQLLLAKLQSMLAKLLKKLLLLLMLLPLPTLLLLLLAKPLLLLAMLPLPLLLMQLLLLPLPSNSGLRKKTGLRAGFFSSVCCALISVPVEHSTYRARQSLSNRAKTGRINLATSEMARLWDERLLA
ncbi:MAG: hypothetical protein Q8K62_08280 [Thiobacillus sp.]|nr:hypothetical protein [Thiobacillus sp.]